MTTIEQAKQAKAVLESSISESLQKFSNDTGLRVNDIDVNPIVTLGGVISYYSVSTEVSL